MHFGFCIFFNCNLQVSLMVYFYEKIDLLFELFSPYELKKNKQRLLKNINIWIAKSLFENEVNKDIFVDLCYQIELNQNQFAQKFQITNNSKMHQEYIKVKELIPLFILIFYQKKSNILFTIRIGCTYPK